MEYQHTTEEEARLALDRIAAICKLVELRKVTILTGNNGSGKSLVRKLLWKPLVAKLGDGRPPQKTVIECSMQSRCLAGSEGGFILAESAALPTSIVSAAWVRRLLEACRDRFVVIDELELGMSEETQFAVCEMLNNAHSVITGKALGALVVTHSRFVVQHLNHDAFLNMEGMSEDQWLSREVKPVDLMALAHRADDLFNAFSRRLASGSEK